MRIVLINMNTDIICEVHFKSVYLCVNKFNNLFVMPSQQFSGGDGPCQTSMRQAEVSDGLPFLAIALLSLSLTLIDTVINFWQMQQRESTDIADTLQSRR